MGKLWQTQPGNKTPGKSTITFDVLEQLYWLPGEHIRGSIIIKVPYSTTVTNARIDLEGLSLIHIINTERSITFSTHKFLSQNYDVRCINKVSHETRKPGLSTYRIPFDFVVSSTISTNADKLPIGSLELPPTMLIGTAIWSCDHRRVFAQPSISYHIVAKVVLLDQSTSASWILREEKAIKIWKTSSIMPPVSIGDFAAEYTTVAETQCGFRVLGSPKLRLRISTTEPAAIAFSCQKSAQTVNVCLNTRLSQPPSYIDERRFRKLLASIKVQVQASLRAKTFYSPIAFEKMPGQTMLTPTSNCRMNNEEVQLGAVMSLPIRPAAASWTRPPIDFEENNNGSCIATAKEGDKEEQGYQNGGPRVDANAPRTDVLWHCDFCCSLSIPHGLVPTFWSTTASRQYSLLLDVKVSGIKLQTKARLEVPLQIFYELEPMATPCGPMCRRLRDGAAGRSLSDWEKGEDFTTIVMRAVDEGSPPMYI